MAKSRKKSHTNNTEQLKTDPQRKNINLKMREPRGNPGVLKWDRELLRLEGASVGCAGCINSQPTRPSDET